MRFVSYILNGKSTWGILDTSGSNIIEAKDIIGEVPDTLLSFIENSEGKETIFKALEAKVKDIEANGNDTVKLLPLSSVKLTSPIPQPKRNIFCVGKNYIEHIMEFDKTKNVDNAALEYPAFFTKATHAMTGPFDEIDSHSDITRQLDYEVELAVIIGKKGVNIKPENAHDYIFGYSILNDMTARDLQKKHLQWFKGKSLDESCPMGPVIVSRNELDWPLELGITSCINGEIRQKSNTKMMIFDLPNLISSLSEGLTLEPGDIIATGTPSGVGMGMEPPRFLKDGDVMRLEIEKIGFMENRIIDKGRK